MPHVMMTMMVNKEMPGIAIECWNSCYDDVDHGVVVNLDDVDLDDVDLGDDNLWQV